MTGAAYVSVYVRETARLDARVNVSVAGGPHAWLYVDEEQDVALWGSPGALRRLAAGLVVAAEEADALVAPRCAGSALDGTPGPAPAAAGGEPVRRAVAGS